jgi:hypothetical protein
VFYEAYLEDPVAKTWAVSRVTRLPKPSLSILRRDVETHTQVVKKGLSLQSALEEMAEFERNCRGRPKDFTVSYPDAGAMGFAHFKAFAEREGYVFDEEYRPLPRPAREALPPGASFFDSDLDSAAKHLRRPAEEFRNDGPLSRAPNAHFLLDRFTAAAHSYDYNQALAATRILNILDRFASQIGTVEEKLTEYCGKYRELGQGGLIDDALKALDTADGSIRQMKAYGVDTKEFEFFLQQCQVTCHVLHARGLFDLMNRGEGDFAHNEALFKSRVDKAAEVYGHIDASKEGGDTLKNMIVQPGPLSVPPTIGKFVAHYKELRPGDPPPQPKPPKPMKPPKTGF